VNNNASLYFFESSQKVETFGKAFDFLFVFLERGECKRNIEKHSAMSFSAARLELFAFEMSEKKIVWKSRITYAAVEGRAANDKFS
jgi:hypothetical protein